MDELSFNERTRAMETKLYRIARSMLRSDADCADALQEAVFAAWRRIPGLRDETRFEPWLTRILVNCCRDIQRNYGKRKMETVLDETCPLASAEPADPALRDALLTLPEKYRLPVLLHHMNGYPVKQVARILLLPSATVKWRIHEGICRLREQLKEDDV